MNFPIFHDSQRLPRQHVKILLLLILTLLLILGSWVGAAMQDYMDKGPIQYEELYISQLESGQIDKWDFYIEAAAMTDNVYLPVILGASAGTSPEPVQDVTIMVAPAADANIVLTVQDDQGNPIIENYDQAPAGEVETIVGLPAEAPGSYQLLVYADPPLATDYALMVLDEESFDFRFQGTLTTGVTESGATAVDSDDFWFFSAAAGDTLTMQVTPLDEMDPYVELYGPDAQLLETIDVGFGGDPERLEDYPLEDSGIFSIRVGEFDFLPMTYTVIVQIESGP